MINKIVKTFLREFNVIPFIFRSPGRINIIGEHTDYNNRFVLPAAIDKAAYIAISLRDDDEIHLVAADLNETIFLFHFYHSWLAIKCTTRKPYKNFLQGCS